MAVLMGAALGRSDEAMQHSSCGRPVAGEREVSGRANVGPTSTAHAAGSGWLLLAAPGNWAPGWLLVVLQPTMAVHVHGCSYSCMAARYTPPATCSWGGTWDAHVRPAGVHPASQAAEAVPPRYYSVQRTAS